MVLNLLLIGVVIALDPLPLGDRQVGRRLIRAYRRAGTLPVGPECRDL